MTTYLRQIRSLCLTLAVMNALPASVVSAQATNSEDEQAIRDVLARFYEGWNTHDAGVEVNLIRPDIAIAHGEWSITGVKERDGTLRPPQKGMFTWTLEKRKESWSIIAAQNTFVR